jgi:hypothetical protein
MVTTIQIKTVEMRTFEELCKQYDIKITEIERAKFGGKPANFYFVEILFNNPVCLIDIGRALEREHSSLTNS